MKIVFFGSGEFAVKSLEALSDSGHIIDLVVTQPDKPKGRRLISSPTPVKARAQELGLNLFQPVDPHDKQAVAVLKKTAADLFVVISYGHILKREILDIPKICPLNVHASLLPKYRGAAPISWALVNAEKETGVSVIRMDERMDRGDMLLQKSIPIKGDDDAVTIEEKLATLSALVILEAVSELEHGEGRFVKQDDSRASSAPKLKKEDGLIDWNNDAATIVNRVRGFVPWPAAFTHWNGKLLKILRARNISVKGNRPGEVVDISKDAITVACANGCVEILELQLASGKRLPATAFVCGHRIKKGIIFGSV